MERGIAVGYARLNSTDCVEQGPLSYTKILLSVITRTDRKQLEVNTFDSGGGEIVLNMAEEERTLACVARPFPLLRNMCNRGKGLATRV